METLFRDLLGLLAILPPLCGCGAAILYLGRSRWAPVLLAGFGLQTLVLLFYRLALFLMSAGQLGGTVQAAFLLAGLLGLVAASVIVAGVVLLLRDSAPGAGAQA